ncbi:MAG: hypothetical protein HYY17_16745 [Planctomycetes bacterium]|nr:hypothetical protein [Planctomycetota bacterium]
MRRWAKRLILFTAAVAVVAAAVGYFAVPRAARSDWALRKAEREMSSALGTPVHIGKLDFTWKNGFVATDVRTDPTSLGDMEAVWTVREVGFRPRPMRVFSKRPKAAAVLREPRMELKWRGEVAQAAGVPVRPPSIRSPFAGRFKGLYLTDFTIEWGVVVIDHPSFIEPVRIDDIWASGELDARKDAVRLEVRGLSARVNGGAVSARGRLEIRPQGASGRLSLSAQNVDVNDFVVEAVRNLQPMVEVEDGGTHKGGMDLHVEGEARADRAGGLLSAFTGRGDLRIFGADLQRSRILHVVGEAVGLPGLIATRFHTVAQKFSVQNGRVLLEEVRAEASEGALAMTGWVGPGGSLDVVVRLDPGLGRGPREAVRVIGTVRRPEAMK